MSLGLEILENIHMVVVSMREKSVDPPDDALHVLALSLLYLEPLLEVFRILQGGSGMVQRVDHVVNGRAILWLTVASTSVQPGVGGLHLGTCLWGADLVLQDDDEEAQLRDELPQVLVLPEVVVNTLRHLANVLHSRWVSS